VNEAHDPNRTVDIPSAPADSLDADLALWGKRVQRGSADRAEARQVLKNWQEDSDLATVHDAAALAKLPADERAACEKLWADVAALMKKAETSATKEGKR
jgi:hypothetical protein